MSEYIVNGEVLGALDYALRGMPTTDNELPPPEPKGLPPYVPPTFHILSCKICGQWAGDMFVSPSDTAEDREAKAATLKNVLCPAHFRTEKIKGNLE